MGINISVSRLDLNENEYLVRFVGKDHIGPEAEEFWNEFLMFNLSNLPRNR